MNGAQIVSTVKLILSDENLRSMKPDDFNLCFKRMQSGFYGKAYDRIDGQIILDALYQYLHERVTECEEISHEGHLKVKNGTEDMEPDPEGQKKVAEIYRKVMSGEQPDYKITTKVRLGKPGGPRYFVEQTIVKKGTPMYKPKKKDIEKSPRDQYIQDCFKEFWNLYKKEGFEKGGKRFIKYRGDIVDELKYAEIKLKETSL